LVKLDQRGRAARVSFHPDFYRLRPIVFTLEQFTDTTIATIWNPRWTLGHVKNRLAIPARTTTTESRHDFGDWQLVVHHR
jgi:hypothetical protein